MEWLPVSAVTAWHFSQAILLKPHLFSPSIPPLLQTVKNNDSLARRI
jgi:hypothetical protein